MVDVLAAPQQGKTDSALRTLVGISIAHWVSHFHLLVLPMLFPFLKDQLGVGYIELGFALTVLAVVSGLTQAPTGYLVDHFGASPCPERARRGHRFDGKRSPGQFRAGEQDPDRAGEARNHPQRFEG